MTLSMATNTRMKGAALCSVTLLSAERLTYAAMPWHKKNLDVFFSVFQHRPNKKISAE